MVSLVLLFSSSAAACRPAPSYITDNATPVISDTTPADAADNSPLVFEAIKASDVTESSAKISWRTNKKTIGQVEYGKTSNYDSIKPPDSYLYFQSATIEHSVTLEGLDANTIYHFRVKSSKDAAGREVVSDMDCTLKTIPLIGCQVGNRPPDFTLKNLDGKDVPLSNCFGKVVLIFFWSDG